MTDAATPLRRLQKDHALILLTDDEFQSLHAKGSLRMPDRHHEHFVRVMRRASSWQALVGDGSGRLLAARVDGATLHLNPDGGTIAVAPKTFEVTLVQAWIKPKALSLVLQKAAEFGVSRIHLVESERSHAVQEKAARIEAVIENACMQAYNPAKPRISTGTLASTLELRENGLLFGDLEAEQRLTDYSDFVGTRRGFINGPEGGFTAPEVERLRQAARPVLLSENVLRSETAAIFALGYLCLHP